MGRSEEDPESKGDTTAFSDVLKAEYHAIRTRREHAAGADVKKTATARRRVKRKAEAVATGVPPFLFGVALSGGGIRSASFCLGALQALDQQGLIKKLDYLSTVSGGGYIGASMVAAMSRGGGKFPFTAAVHGEGDIRDSEPVSHIRDNGRFLAPRGVPDLLISLMIILRGLMVNLLLVLSVLLPIAAIIILTNPSTQFLGHSVVYDVIDHYIAGKWGQYRLLDALEPMILDPFVVSKVLGCLVALWLVGWALWRSFVESYYPVLSRNIFEPGSRGSLFGRGLFIAFVIALAAELQPVIIGALIELLARSEMKESSIGTFTAAAAAVMTATAAFRGTLTSWIQKALNSPTFGARVQAFLARAAFYALGLALPLLIYGLFLLLVIAGIRRVGVAGKADGYPFMPRFLAEHDATPAIIAAIVLAVFLIVRTGIIMGRDKGRSRIVELLLALARQHYDVWLIVWLVLLGLFLYASAVATRVGTIGAPEQWAVLANYLTLSLFIGALCYNFAENANGLHRLYRDRLRVAFRLGKGRNPFPLQEIDEDCPYLLVNGALNVRRSKPASRTEGRIRPPMAHPASSGPSQKPPTDPAKRGRNAEFFLFSRLFVGSDSTGYVPTGDMARVEPQLDLATATAISGAAVSSSMGRVNIGLLGPTLALLNLRLGFWLRNPRFVSMAKPATIRDWDDILRLYLFAEAFGRLRSDSSRIYITDGGHIDNIGLYQLLKRRCKFIIVIDSEADVGMNFGAFCDAQRFSRIDEGVRILLDWQPVREAALARAVDRTKRVPTSADAHDRHFAVGRILYEDDSEEGMLLYVKATVTGDEPDYVLDYERRYPQFPHEATSDQFFSEEQMEAYRSLGFHATMRALTSKPRSAPPRYGGSDSETPVARMKRILAARE